MKRKIYLDNAATTPVDKDVFAAMEPYFSEIYANPSSVHGEGQEAQEGLVLARKKVADFLNSDVSEIIFTSGATEGNNTVIKGISASEKIKESAGGIPHIIVSSIEHDCIIESAKRMMKEKIAEVTFVPVGEDGLVNVEEIKKAIRPNTVLVSVMYANNEIGSIQPIIEIGEMIDGENRLGHTRIYFHTDAVQAVNYLDCDVQKLKVDMMTISGHKIYGPKGVGVLYVRKGVPIMPLMDGGEQEYRLRAGTHNMTGIVGIGAAVDKVIADRPEISKTTALRDKLIDGILSKISGTALNGLREKRLPNNANIRFEGTEGEAILVMLDMEGIAVSTGSACAARSLSPSHVLKAMGLVDIDAHSSIRFSLGRNTTEEDINRVIEVLPGIIEKLRGVSGSFNNEDLRNPTAWKDDEDEEKCGTGCV
ncbi:MAG: cysteine desulfurase family protein [Candidatus Colwellbacteria bacterium]|nr:cysteine desulfurase family protein [Candidatus Colwellbacteria bacterium]